MSLTKKETEAWGVLSETLKESRVFRKIVRLYIEQIDFMEKEQKIKDLERGGFL